MWSATRTNIAAGNEGTEFFSHVFIRLYLKAECTTVSLFNAAGNNTSNMRVGYNLFSVSKRIVNSAETSVLAMEVVRKKSFLVLIYFAMK